MATVDGGAPPAVRSPLGLPGLRPQTAALLAHPETLAPPLRGALYGIEAMREHARALAASQPVERRQGWRARGARFLPRLRQNIESLRRVSDHLLALSADGEALALPVQQLVDQLHALHAQLPALRAALQARRFRRLPRLRAAPLAGLPRIYAIAWSFVTHSDSSLDANLLLQALLAYQEVEELQAAELQALPLVLKLVLLENLARLAEGIACRHAAAEAADRCLEHATSLDHLRLDRVATLLRRRGVAEPFLARLRQRLDAETPPALATETLRDWAATQSQPAAPSGTAPSGEEAADLLSLRHAVGALQAVDLLDWTPATDSASLALQRLKASPAFAADSPETRTRCLDAVARLATRLRRPESEVAQRAVELAESDEATRACGPAHALIGPGQAALSLALGEPARPDSRGPRQRCRLYVGGLLAGTLLWIYAVLDREALVPWAELLTVLLLLVPAVEITLAWLQRALGEFAPTRPLPSRALADGVPPEQRTVVALQTVLTETAQITGLVQRLEQHWLANREPNVQFALLADLPDAPQRQGPVDALLIDAARAEILALNQRHPRAAEEEDVPRFVLLLRERSWSASEAAWIGWDRWRGQREQLVAHLAGSAPSPFMDLGADSRLAPDTVLALLLRPTTLLPPGSLRRLVAIAAHPLNAPQWDEAQRRVVAGYAVLQPRLAAALPGGGAPDAGLDAGVPHAEDVHQRLFEESRFDGQGLVHVRAFHQATRGRVPEDRHRDAAAFEGLWARTARVDEVTLLHGVPAAGDPLDTAERERVQTAWQALALWPQALHGRVGLINLWRLVDAARAALLPLACVALLWWSFALQTVPPALALLTVIAAHALSPMLAVLGRALPRDAGVAAGPLLRATASGLLRALRHAALQLCWLLPRAGSHTEAIVQALAPGLGGRRRLSTAPAPHWLRSPAFAPTAALVLTFCGVLVPGSAAGALLALGLVLGLGPAAVTLAAPRLRRAARTDGLDDGGQLFLRQLARDSWRYFERHADVDDQHLPAERVQLAPRELAAHRTGPAEIGLGLLATACAHRLGLIGSAAFVGRLEATFATLQKLPRHRGHLHAHIDTQTLRVLAPVRIDTIGSGLLAASLWAVAQACREAAGGPAPHAAREAALQAAVQRLRDAADPALRAQLKTPALQALLQHDLWALWRRAPAQLRGLLAAAQAACDAQTVDPTGPVADLLALLEDLLRDREADREGWPARLRALASRAETLVAAMDFSLLYDADRRLLRTGYRVDDALPEPGHHLALASPARLASLVAMAKGDVPAEHWWALTRHLVASDHGPVLQTAEDRCLGHLLPALLLDEPSGSLLHGSRLSLVADLPWLNDAAAGPQPAWLALLALPDVPQHALLALQRLQRAGAFSRHGLLEAAPGALLDDELPPGAAVPARGAGLGLVVTAHVLADAPVRRWLAATPAWAAHQTLLHERLPHEAVWLPERTLAALPALPDADEAAARPLDPAQLPPALSPSQWLGNGRLSVWLRPQGGGLTRWQQQQITRWDDDLLRDAGGSWLMLREGDEVEFHSLTQAPNPRPDAFYRTRFHPERVEFDADCDAWRSTVTCWVSPEDDIEFRQVSLQNLEDHPTTFELLSVVELAMQPEGVDSPDLRASVQAQALDDRSLLLQRGPGAGPDTPLCVAHFLARCDVEPLAVRLTTDRASLAPRGAPPGQWRPATAQRGSVHRPVRLPTGHDPVASIAVRLVVPPQSRVCLCFATAVASDAPTLRQLADEYRRDLHLKRSLQMAASVATLRLHEQRLSQRELALAHDLCTPLAAHLGRPVKMAAPGSPRALPPEMDPQAPWLLVQLGQAQGLAAVQTLRRLHAWWQAAGLRWSLVVVDTANSRPGSRPDSPAMARRPGVHWWSAETLSPEVASWLRLGARLELVADGRPLHQLLAQALAAAQAPSRTAAAAGGSAAPLTLPDRRWRAALMQAPSPGEAAPWRFTPRGFELLLSRERMPPRAWPLLLGHRRFGTVVDDAGAGHSWVHQDGEGRRWLTWPRQDPLLPASGEHFFVQDLASGETWTLLPALERQGRDGMAVHFSAHGARFEQRRGELRQRLTLRVDPAHQAKHVGLRLQHLGSGTRTLRVAAMVEWWLGTQAADRMSLATEFVPEQQLVLAAQPAATGAGVAWLMLLGARTEQWTCARQEFYDRTGRLGLPRTLGGASGMGLDPCGALDGRITLASGQSVSLRWVIGHAPDRDAALAMARRFAEGWPPAAGVAPPALPAPGRSLQVSSPDPAFDAMVNHWLPWQARALADGLASGLPAATPPSVAQRLLEAMAGSHDDPAHAEQCLLALAAQAGEHEGDALLAAAERHTRVTGDARWLGAGADEATTLEARLAAQLDALAKQLASGALPPSWARLRRLRRALGWLGRPEQQAAWRQAADAAEQALRAGPPPATEAAAGTWSLDELVACVHALPPGDPVAREALQRIDHRLLDRRSRLLRSHSSAAQHETPDDEAATAHPPAPAQHTSAVAAAVLAHTRCAAATAAWDHWRRGSPAHRAAGAAGQRRYRGAPFHVAGAVSTEPLHEGLAGPPWGPGAGPLLLAAVEGLLGLVIRGDRLCLSPCLPPEWPEVRLRLVWRGHVLQLRLQRGPSLHRAADERALQPGEWIALDGLPAHTRWHLALPASAAASAQPQTRELVG